MNIREVRKRALEKHYIALEKLAGLCGVNNPNGRAIRRRMIAEERMAKDAAVRYANGKLSWEDRMAVCTECAQNVQAVFNNRLEGLNEYGDVHGYQLTIDGELVNPVSGKYKDIGLVTNLGGNAPLAYDFESMT